MAEKNRETRTDIDYLEYTDKQTIEDCEQAQKNLDTVNEQQDKLNEDILERNNSWKSIDEFLAEEYQDKTSKEYLVDGAILTCTNCTKETTYIGEEVQYRWLNGTILSEEGPEEEKIYRRLTVTENKDASIDGLKYATVVDSKAKKNIPYFGNCKRDPDSDEEMEKLKMYHKVDSVSIGVRDRGTCEQLMKLESEWENFIINGEYLTFGDDEEGIKSGITMTSMLFCRHGGFIYPVASGQGAIAEEEEDNNSEEIIADERQDNYEEAFTYIDKDGNIKTVIWNISETEFIDNKALSLEEIEKICNSKNPELVTLGYAEGIYNYCSEHGLNPKILLATLGQEQSWCKNGNYEKAFGVGTGGNPQNFSDSTSGIASAGKVYINQYNNGLAEDSLVLKRINCDSGPNYPETKAACRGEMKEWQDNHINYVKYMEEGQDIECVNAAMYARLKYTPWLDFPPQNSHPLETWLNIYNSLEESLTDE